jgi:Zinc finger, C3HC4 type (RING finger)
MNFSRSSDPNLCKILIKCYNEKHTEDIETTSMDDKNISNVMNNENNNQPPQQPQQAKLDSSEGNVDECLLCSEQKRDTVFKPCGHVVSCEACGSRIKKCLICRESVSSREKVGKQENFESRDTQTFSFARLMNASFAPTAKRRFSSSLVVTWCHVTIAHRS